MAKKGTGWGGVFSIYPIRKFGKGCILPGILLILSIVAFFFGKADALPLIMKVSGFITAGFPSIIGFILTGYALLIGFSGTEMFGNMARNIVDNEHSYFQIVNAIFAVVLGIVICTYIIGCVVDIVVGMEIVWPFAFGNYKYYNNIVLFVFLFIFYYSIFALVDIIVNVFNIGQYANALAQKKEIPENDKENKNIVIRILRYIFIW